MAGAGVLILAFLRRPPVAPPSLPTSPTTATNYGASFDESPVATTDSSRSPTGQHGIVIDPLDDAHAHVHGAVVAGSTPTNTKEEEAGQLMKRNQPRSEQKETFLGSFGKYHIFFISTLEMRISKWRVSINQ